MPADAQSAQPRIDFSVEPRSDSIEHCVKMIVIKNNRDEKGNIFHSLLTLF